MTAAVGGGRLFPPLAVPLVSRVMNRVVSLVLASIVATVAVVATMRMPAFFLLYAAHRFPDWLDARVVLIAAQASALALIFVSLCLSPRRLSPGGVTGFGLRAIGWFVAATFLFSLLVGLTLLIGAVQGGTDHAERLLSRWASELTVAGVPGRLLLAGLFVPILEELLFRGLLLGYLLRSAPAWLALAISTLLFALGHDSSLLSGVIGFGLGLIYLRFRNVWLCVLAHSAHNLLSTAGASFLAAWLADRGVSLALGYWTLPVQLTWFVLVLACAAMFLKRVFGRIEGKPPLRMRQPVVPVGGATT